MAVASLAPQDHSHCEHGFCNRWLMQDRFATASYLLDLLLLNLIAQDAYAEPDHMHKPKASWWNFVLL